MNLSAILTALRYILAAAGGFIVSKGWLDAETLEQVIGAILVLIPAVAGIITNIKNKSKAEAAKVVLTAADPGVTKTEVAKAAAKIQA